MPTKSIIRIALEEVTYAHSNIAHEPATDCPERIWGLQELVGEANYIPDDNLFWRRALETFLDGTRDGSEHPWDIVTGD